MTDNSNLPPTSEEVKSSSETVKRAPVKEVPGLTLFPDYVSKAEEKVLWDGLEALPWCIDYTRKLQYYGYRNELIAPYSLVKISNPIPDILQNLLDRIIKDKICRTRPDQVIINDYEPGQGIRPHFDRKDYFEEQIIGISLGSDCVMEWTRDQKGESEKHKTRIPSRSMYVVEGLARYKYKHGIPGRKNDVYEGTTDKVARQRRISITFRKVIESQVKKTPRIYYNHEKNTFEEIDQMAPESDAKTDVSDGSSKKRKFDADDYVGPVEKVNPILKQLKQTTISPKAIEGVTRIVLGKFK